MLAIWPESQVHLLLQLTNRERPTSKIYIQDPNLKFDMPMR